MLKQFLNNASPTSLMLWDAESEAGVAEEKAKLREQLSKGNLTKETPVVEEEGIEEEDGEKDEETEEGEDEETDGDEKVEETAEEKTEREKKEREEFKAKRKEERVQKRIDEAVKAQRLAEADVLKWKTIAEAKPEDQKLTEAEVQARADAIANEKVTNLELNRLQKEFTNNCDKIQDAAEKLDKDFNKKVNDLAAELGPLPNQMLNVLFDLDNGPKVLKYLVDDVDEAERIYGLVNNPARLGIALSKISDKLIEADKPKKKEISNVPDPMKPVNGSRVQSTQITQKDTTSEGMDNYVRKRQLEIEQRRKQGR